MIKLSVTVCLLLINKILFKLRWTWYYLLWWYLCIVDGTGEKRKKIILICKKDRSKHKTTVIIREMTTVKKSTIVSTGKRRDSRSIRIIPTRIGDKWEEKNGCHISCVWLSWKWKSLRQTSIAFHFSYI